MKKRMVLRILSIVGFLCFVFMDIRFFKLVFSSPTLLLNEANIAILCAISTLFCWCGCFITWLILRNQDIRDKNNRKISPNTFPEYQFVHDLSKFGKIIVLLSLFTKLIIAYIKRENIELLLIFAVPSTLNLIFSLSFFHRSKMNSNM